MGEWMKIQAERTFTFVPSKNFDNINLLYTFIVVDGVGDELIVYS